MMERLVEDLSFNADQRSGETINIDGSYVNNTLSEVVKDEDLSRFIL
jgi:ATP-dependent HslUV protease ATP-binding subunit HslU